MSNIHLEEREVFGELITDFGRFHMLDEFPTKTGIPWYLREELVLSFFIVDTDGFGKHILLAGNNWLIKPASEPHKMVVNFLLDNESNEEDN